MKGLIGYTVLFMPIFLQCIYKWNEEFIDWKRKTY